MGLLDNPIAGSIKNIVNKVTGFSGPAKLRGPDFPDGFQVTELVGGEEPARGTEDDYTFVLLGAFMPQMPFQYGGEQKIVKEYYPGNPQPTVQMLGAREANTKITGTLRGKKLTADLAGACEETAKAFDILRRRGSLLRLELGEWVRYGFLEKSDFKMKTLQEIDYELDFLIIGDTKPVDDFFTATSSTIPTADNSALQDANELFKNMKPPGDMPSSIAGTINALINDVASAVNLVTDFVDAVISEAQDIQKSLNRAIGLVKNAQASISIYKRQIGSLALYVGTASLKSNAAVVSRTKQMLNAHFLLEALHATARPLFAPPAYLNGVPLQSASVQSTTTLDSLLASMRAQFESLRASTPKFRHLVKLGQTLQQISQQYYKTPDNWGKLYDHNKLTSTALVEGTVLEIPDI